MENNTAAPCCPKCASPNAAKAGWRGATQKYCCKDCGTYYVGEYANKLPEDKTPCPTCDKQTPTIRNGNGGGKQRLVCKICSTSFYSGRNLEPDRHPDKKTLLITSAVNDTPVHVKFLRSLKTYAETHDAEIIVIPLRYLNPTSKDQAKNECTWSSSVLPYLYDGRMKICDGLQLLADIKTQPTAQNPLTGLDGFTGSDCGIVGHTRVALESIATRGHELPKLMMTTGAVTMPEYSDTLAGKRGEFHHVFGAVVVQVDDDGIFHLRHIHANKSGEFIDLDTTYTPTEAKPAPRPAALVMGDIHAERVDLLALEGTHKIIDALKPKRLIMHDVLDFGSASHHNSYFDKFLRHHTGKNSVIRELKTTCDLIDSLHRDDMESVIVSSNHHNHLLRWLSDSRNGEDVENAEFYHSIKAETLSETIKTCKVPNPFKMAAQKLLKTPAKFLGDKDSYMVAGVELAFHGDLGSNGARGSAKSMDKIGVKTVIGHSHSPKIIGGCYQTGTTSQLDMGYNHGASSWLHSHVIIYANGKRSHIHLIKGRPWR